MVAGFEKELVHAELIGRVVIAWNEVQWMVYRLFVVFSGMSEDQAKDVFFSLRSDSTQRDLTLAAGKSALAKSPTLWNKFRITMCAIGTLASERNAAIHTMWGFNFYEALSGATKLTFGPMGDTARHKALKDDFATQCDELIAELKKHFFTLSDVYKELNGLPSPDTRPPKKR